MTDIVGSTEHASELGDSAWRDLIQQHHALVRRVLRAHGGSEIDTAGDGFFATFDAPAEAVRCGLEVAASVRELGVEIRAGAHTGEVEQVGPKVGGITVPIAARIMAEAGPGEVLVSSTVRDLAAGAGLRFDDRGTRQLKGVAGEWHIYAAAAASVTGSIQADVAADPRALRAAAVRRSRSRPIWRRRPRVALAALVALALIAGSTGLWAWQPWLRPALAAIPDNAVGLIEASRNVITAAIEVGEQPGGAAVADGALWVTNTGADTVSQISLSNQSVTRIVDVGRAPIGITTTDGTIWVANSASRTVSLISTATARVVRSVEVGNGPTAIDAGAGFVWVANAGDSTVVKLDPTTAAVVSRIPVAARPSAIIATDGGVWVASADNASLTHIDPGTGVTLAAPISLGGLPVGLAERATEVWVATTDGNIARIDVRSTIMNGKGRMPAFPHITDVEMETLVTYIVAPPGGAFGRGRGSATRSYPPGPVVGSGGAQVRTTPAGGRGRLGGPRPYPEGVEQTPQYTINAYGTIGVMMKPPFTKLSRYDLNAGTIKWQVGLGDDARLAAHGITGTGVTQMRSSLIVTSGGLIFAPGGDSKLRAYDTETGTLLWTSPALGGTIRGGHSMYQIGDRQYVLVAVSGDTPPAGQWPRQEGVTLPTGYIAFALPQ
jgi:YVTN family beta-propeller protein